MDLKHLLKHIDAPTAQAFVTASRHVIDALLIEAERIEQTRTPPERNYNDATLRRDTPAGGWLSTTELRAATQRMSEALAAEKWTEGAAAAIRALSMIGAL